MKGDVRESRAEWGAFMTRFFFLMADFHKIIIHPEPVFPDTVSQGNSALLSEYPGKLQIAHAALPSPRDLARWPDVDER